VCGIWFSTNAGPVLCVCGGGGVTISPTSVQALKGSGAANSSTAFAQANRRTRAVLSAGVLLYSNRGQVTGPPREGITETYHANILYACSGHKRCHVHVVWDCVGIRDRSQPAEAS
jgi:hypothetical protein